MLHRARNPCVYFVMDRRMRDGVASDMCSDNGPYPGKGEKMVSACAQHLTVRNPPKGTSFVAVVGRRACVRSRFVSEKNPPFTAFMPAALEAARRRIQSTCVSKLTFCFSSRCYFLASCLCCRCAKRLPCLPGIAIPRSFLARPRCTAVPDR